MDLKILSYDEIDPYIRYMHLFEVEKGHPLPSLIAYDHRLMYVCDGNGYVTVDNIKYEAAKGCLFIWKPGINYTLHPSAESSLSIIGINFDFTHSNCKISFPIPPEGIVIFDHSKITENVSFTDVDVFNRPIFLRNLQGYEALLLDMLSEYTIRKKFYLQKVHGYFLSLLSDIARHLTSTFTDKESTNHTVDLILNYIRENYVQPITNKEIGEHFNFHPVYINRLLVKYTGTSLHQYLIDYRISMAIGLLQNSSKSVTEIAYEVGFKDINYFSKYFKKTVGLSPKNYAASRSSSFVTFDVNKKELEKL